MRFAALLLAAGQSTRMGSPKALLSVGSATFIDETTGAVRALSPTDAVMVTSPGLQDILAPGWAGRIVLNPDPQSSQFDSLRLGLRALIGVEGAFIFLVDNPGRLAERSQILLRAVQNSPGELLVAGYLDQPGHPLWLPVSVWDDVQAWDGTEGLRGFFRSMDRWPRVVETGMAEALSDIDHPGDLRRFQEGMQQ